MLSRMGTHQGEKIPFDEVRVVRCKPEDLDMLEAVYIRKYDPPYTRDQAAARWPSPTVTATRA
jgi:hypothetical protein